MRRFSIVVAASALLFAGAVTTAQDKPSGHQPAAAGHAATVRSFGNAEAGKAVWALGNTSCRNCHGGQAEGAFAPTLAGRGQELTFDFVRNYVRAPTGKMPAFVESQLTDQEIADLAAYFASLPPAKPGPWRTVLPAGEPPQGQFLAVVEVGCAQCHGATLDTPRHGLAEANGDWGWFKHQVYEHHTAIREQWAQLDPSLPQVTPGPAGPPGRSRVRMGNYDRKRLPEATLKQIFDWAIDLGYLPPLAAPITAAPAQDGGVTYTIRALNSSIRNKGVAAENVRVAVVLPAGANVRGATGTGYQGTRRVDHVTQAAVWLLPRLAAAESETLTITLSAPAPDLRGNIHWAKPAVKADQVVLFSLPRGRRGGGGGVN